MNDQSARGPSHGQGATQRFADQVFGHGVAHVPAHHFARAAVKPNDQVQPVTSLAGQVRNIALLGMTHPRPVRGRGSRLAQQAVGRGAHGWVRVGRAGHERVGLLGRTRRARRPARSARAGCASGPPDGLGPALRYPLPAGAVALAVIRKCFAPFDLPGRLDRWYLPAAVPGIIRGRGHPQGLAELTHRHVARPLSEVLMGTHGVGWPKMIKAFFKYPAPALAVFWPRAGPVLLGRGLLPRRPLRPRVALASGGKAAHRLIPNCWAAACLLRLSLARRRALASKASSYLRRLSGDDPLFVAVITEETYVLLLSTISRPPKSAA